MCYSSLKPTIHEATFVAGNTATLLFVHAAHGNRMVHSTSRLEIDGLSILNSQATCRM